MTSETDKTLRVFCAVELPPEVRERVGVYVAGLREKFSHVRASWERAEKLHLTLKFIGEMRPTSVESLSQAAGRAASSAGPFSISIEGAGAFPPRGPARVLWLGVADDSGGLASLHKRLEEECHAAGFPREQRPFSPHLTLARLRTPAGVRPLAEHHKASPFEPAPFTVSELVVMRSELTPAGSRYTPISRHRLGHAT
jgi:2'-5' RNA ligase